MSPGSKPSLANLSSSAIQLVSISCWYLIRFAGESPFSFSALGIKTYAMALLKKDYRRSTKDGMPKHWFDPHPHTHIALDDAIEQGALFCNMLAENLRKP